MNPRQPDDLLRFRFADAAGHAVDPADLRIDRCLKFDERFPRSAFHATLGERPVLLKIQRHRTLRARFRATVGRSYLRHEVAMTAAARRAALPVPEVVGYGRLRVAGLVVAEALLVEWLDDRRSLHDLITDAVREGNTPRLEAARFTLAESLAAVRRAGMADKDFGSHNVLIRIDAADDATALDWAWIDLERAVLAPPDDPRATADAVASVLARWWRADPGHDDRLNQLAAELIRRLPLPRGGWPPLADPIERSLHRRIAKAVHRRQAEQPPPPIRWPATGETGD